MTEYFINKQTVGPDAIYEIDTDISRRAAIWMRENPTIMQWYLEQLQRYKNSGYFCSAGFLMGLYRHFMLEDAMAPTSRDELHEGYKMNSAYGACIARTLVLRDLSMLEVLEFRRIEGEYPTFGSQIEAVEIEVEPAV